MNKVQQITAYYLSKSRSKSISKLRLTKTLYLCDWFSALLHNKTMTNLEWQFNYCVKTFNLDTTIMSGQYFRLIKQNGLCLREEYQVISYLEEQRFDRLNEKEVKIIDYILEKYDELYFNDLMNHVFSTYPLSEDTIYRKLDLCASALRFHEKNNRNKKETKESKFSFDF